MAKGPQLQDRVVSAILDTASEVLAVRGDGASMTEIAEAAGVGRATLYRYFPNRDALLNGLAASAMASLAERVAEASLDSVPVAEGIARVSRGFVAEGGRYAALINVGKEYLRDSKELDIKVAQPVRDLLARGVADGTLRDDLHYTVLFELYTGLLEKALELVLGKQLGVEPAASAITTIFLSGAGAGAK